MWYFSFFDSQLNILRSAQGWKRPEEAVTAARNVLRGESAPLLDAQRTPVGEAEVDLQRGFTLETDRISPS